MKKSTNHTTRRKLVVTREAIAQLTPLQLRTVAGGNEGGWTGWPPFCVGDPAYLIKDGE